MKNRQTLSNINRILMVSIFFVIAGAAGLAAAHYPPAPVPSEERLLAARLNAATDSLCQAAHGWHSEPDAVEADGLVKIDRLDGAASHYQRELARPARDCKPAEADSAGVVAAYHHAAPYFPAIVNNQEVELAVLRTRNALRDLCDDRRPAVPVAVAIHYGEMRGLAEQISEIATQLEDRAREERKMARVTQEQVAFIERLNTAAKQYYVRVVSAPKTHGGCGEEYRELMERLAEARQVAGGFTPDFQGYFRSLWELTAHLYVVPAKTPGMHEGWKHDGGKHDGCRVDGHHQEGRKDDGCRVEAHHRDGWKRDGCPMAEHHRDGGGCDKCRAGGMHHEGCMPKGCPEWKEKCHQGMKPGRHAEDAR